MKCKICGSELSHDGGRHIPLYGQVVYSYSCGKRDCDMYGREVETKSAPPGSGSLTRRAFAPLKDAIKLANKTGQPVSFKS